MTALDEAQQELSNPQNEDECSIDLTETIAKEILMHLRIRLGKQERSDKGFFEICKLLGMILQNIAADPGNPKFLKLKMSNKKV